MFVDAGGRRNVIVDRELGRFGGSSTGFEHRLGPIRGDRRRDGIDVRAIIPITQRIDRFCEIPCRVIFPSRVECVDERRDERFETRYLRGVGRIEQAFEREIGFVGEHTERVDAARVLTAAFEVAWKSSVLGLSGPAAL